MGSKHEQLIHFTAVRRFGSGDTQLVVRVVGELDLVTVVAFTSALELALGTAVENDVTEVVIDLRSVRFLSAAGLSELVRAQRRSHRDGRPLRVVADQWAVTAPLRLTGLNRTLGLSHDLDTLPEIAEAAV